MGNRVFKFYKENLGMYNMVFKNMKKTYFSPLVFLVVLIIIVIILKDLKLINNTILYILYIAIIIFSIILFFIINCKAKKIIKKFYGKKLYEKESNIISRWDSNNEALEAIRNKEKSIFCKYLRRKYLIQNSQDIERLLNDFSELESELKNDTFKWIAVPSFLGALFLSVWNNFWSWVYNPKNMKELSKAIDILVNVTVALIEFLAVFIMLNIAYEIFKTDVINKKHKQICECTVLLKEIYADFKIEETRKK
ncbi:hypothetical protein KYB31_15775 [Clostridium felsineum]|uniref:hypothetical protein n=1 Tax=Clostridium felsineum TaxID=36839 RepID=UPI00214DE318|nr:hypothetical protein [Clostridium felsineum]MCR3760437.1 hypothetical protein [Clostridium felsineum]